MSSTVTCHCGAHFEIPDSTVERRVNCPKCNSVIFLAAPSEKSDPSDGYGLNVDPLEEEQAAKPKGRKGSPDWLERYGDSKETVRGDHSKTFTLIGELAGVNATLDPLGAALFLAVSHSDAETSVAALAKVAITRHPTYTAVARALLDFVGPSDATGAEHLVELLLETTDEGSSLRLIHTLERIGPTSLVRIATLLKLLESPHEQARGWVVQCFEKIGRPARHAVEPLLRSIKGATHEVKVKILAALGAIGRDPARVVPLLLQGLRHAAADFRQQGVIGLKSFGDQAASAIPELKALIAKEVDPNVRQSAIETLAVIAKATERSAGTHATEPASVGLLEVTCQCGKHLKAKPELAGRKAKCPACGQNVILPTESTVPRAVVPASGPPPTDATEKDCPCCLATVPLAMVICVSCGFDFRTGKLVKKPKHAT